MWERTLPDERKNTSEMFSLQLRPYEQKDRLFFAACWENAEDYAHAFEGTLHAFLEPLSIAADGLGLFLIMKDKEEYPIGACRLQVRDGGRICWLKTLFIQPAFRRKGYGSSAFKEILHLLSRKTELLILSVAIENYGALAFWECLGFTPDQFMTAKLAAEKQVVILKMHVQKNHQ